MVSRPDVFTAMAEIYLHSPSEDEIPEREKALARDHFQVFAGLQGAAPQYVDHSPVETMASHMRKEGIESGVCVTRLLRCPVNAGTLRRQMHLQYAHGRHAGFQSLVGWQPWSNDLFVNLHDRT